MPLPPQFPAPRLPESPAEQKLLGVYPQRQEGRYMQRVRLFGGRLGLEQWRVAAQAATDLADHPFLHLTTRQCIEWHGLSADAVPELQRRLAEAGMTTVGAAGDTVRAVTVCGGCSKGPDLTPIARRFAEELAQLDGVWQLPRKFKISLSACGDACARPWVSDVGFVLVDDGRLSAIVAGSLGPKPATGVRFAKPMTAEEAVALVRAAVRLFAAEGDRENRRRARLRHARERLGDQEFLVRLAELWTDERGARIEPVVDTPLVPQRESLSLPVPLGELPAEDVLSLVAVAKQADARLTVGFEHDLLVEGLAAEELPAYFAGLLGAARMMACPGTTFCPLAAASTHDAARALAGAVEGIDVTFGISGCPNGCTYAAAAEIGLSGRTKTVGGERVELFSVYAGGDAGRGPALGELVEADVPLDRIAQAVRAAAAGLDQKVSS